MSVLDQAASRRIVERLGDMTPAERLTDLYLNDDTPVKIEGSITWLEPDYPGPGQIGLEGVFTSKDLRTIAALMDGLTVNW